jgi:hypothetical protein
VGEYRSHLLIERIPEYTDIVSSSKKGIQIQVKALVSATLPLIVRHGEMVAQVKINDFLFKPAVVGTPAALRFALRRNGNSSVYGDLTFDFVSPAGETRHIGRREGIAIYFPNTHRLMHMDLPDLKPGKGKLVVSYWLPESTQDSKPLAQAEYIFSE